MKQILPFLKTCLSSGALVMLPAWLAITTLLALICFPASNCPRSFTSSLPPSA